MKLQLTRNSPTCTVFATVSPDGSVTPLYHVYTSSSFMSSNPTVVSRISPSVARRSELMSSRTPDVKACSNMKGVEPIAQIHFSTWSDARVIYDGKTLDMRKFMPANGMFTA